jgi:predicted RNA-binding Zn ribbon-like protein
MTGENGRLPPSASLQPGGRRPAPGSLALVQAFINTHFDLEVDFGADVLASPQGLAEWLHGAGLTDAAAVAGEHDLAHALAVRESLRALAETGNYSSAASTAARERLNAAAAGAGVEVRFGADGPWFTSPAGAGVDGAIGVLLAIVARSLADGSWSRLKICPGHHCGWAFYDHSRNRSGRWCSMSVCGGREKARAHYHRRRGGEV